MSRVTKLRSSPKERYPNQEILNRIIKTTAININISPSAVGFVLEQQRAKTPPSNLHISDFEIGCTLSSGNFGRVFLARHRSTSYICALKCITKSEIANEEEECLIRREIEVHQNLAHPNILRLLNWFHDETNVYLVLEYAPEGNLSELLRKQPRGRFKEPIVAKYMAQLAQALTYMHSKGIMHRDVRPEHILLGVHHEIKLADFGYSIHTASGPRTPSHSASNYVPPEIAIMLLQSDQSNEMYTKAVDQWNLGILTYELLVGKPPFETKSDNTTQSNIVDFDGKIRFPGHVSKGAEEFILELLNLDARNRMALDDVLTHPWILRHIGNSVQARLSGLL